VSVKGYDAQVIVHRLTEVAKDNANLLRRPDIRQDQMSVQIRTESQEKRNTIETVEKTENEAINPDAENASPGYQQMEQEQHPELDEMLPGEQAHKIDVRV